MVVDSLGRFKMLIPLKEHVAEHSVNISLNRLGIC